MYLIKVKNSTLPHIKYTNSYILLLEYSQLHCKQIHVLTIYSNCFIPSLCHCLSAGILFQILVL